MAWIRARDIRAGVINTLALGANALAATVAGRAIMASGYFNEATFKAKVAAGAVDADRIGLPEGHILVGNSSAQGSDADLGGTANGLPVGDGAGVVAVKTIQDATPAITMGGNTASGTSSISMDGSTAADGTGAVTGNSGDFVISAMWHQTVTAPAATSTTAIAAREEDNVADGVWVGVFTNPDVPRCVTISFETTWAGGHVTVAGTDWNNMAQTEVIAATPGSTVDGNKPFKTVTGATNESVGPGGANHGATIGFADRLGLQKIPTLPLGVVAVAGANTTEVATWGMRWFDATTACDGQLDFNVAYPVDVPHNHAAGSYAGPSHTHSATGLTATDAGHTHASTGLTGTNAAHGHSLA